MQQKGERENMTNGECCRYIRTYSELEGLQHACTLVYCAASTPQGVLAQLRREQGGKVRSSTVLAPADSFGRVMRLLRYLCENGVGPEQWLEVLEDVHQPYQLLDTSKNAINIASGRSTMAEDTHSEKMQVMGTDTITMTKVFFNAPRKMGSANRVL